MTLKQRRINVDATSRRRVDFEKNVGIRFRGCVGVDWLPSSNLVIHTQKYFFIDFSI